MSDRQAKIAATIKAGMALRRRSSPAATVRKSPSKSSNLNSNPIIALPVIPTGCTPPRPSSAASRPPLVDSPLQVHAAPLSELDFELLNSPPPVRASSADLARRVQELEKLLQVSRDRSRSPVDRARRDQAASPRARGRPATRQVRRVRLEMDPSPPPTPASDVFSRLGSPVSQDRYPVDVVEEPVDVNWTTLISLGLQLSGQRRSPSPDPEDVSEGLLASVPTQSQARFSFPPSRGVVESLKKAHELFSAGADKECRPEALPSEATTIVKPAKFGKTFNLRFHGGNFFPLSILNAKPSAEELSYLKPRAEPAVPVARVGEIEAVLRKNVRALSTLDWLLNTVREVSKLPHQDETVMEALWMNIHKTLGFCTDFASGAMISTLVARREAFLKSCDPLKVPKKIHTWAAVRSPFSTGRPSLLGDTGDVLRSASREEREWAIVHSLSNRQQGARNNNSNSNNGNSYQRRQRNTDAPRQPRVASTVSRPPATNQQQRSRSGNSTSSSFRRGGAAKQH